MKCLHVTSEEFVRLNDVMDKAQRAMDTRITDWSIWKAGASEIIGADTAEAIMRMGGAMVVVHRDEDIIVNRLS